jgi:hypothetical protein
VTSDPPGIQGPPWNPCGQPNGGDEGPLVVQALCATQLLFPCPQNPAANYPRADEGGAHADPAGADHAGPVYQRAREPVVPYLIPGIPRPA